MVNLFNFVNVLDSFSDVSDLCKELAPALRIVGVIYKGIR